MQYNVIAVFSSDERALLFCQRRKPPYKGMLNFVGGKIEPGEEHLRAAYRELSEETAITESDIELIHIIDMSYPLEDCLMEVYAGRLREGAAPHGDENELVWCDASADFSDVARFAGCGNVYHAIKYIEKCHDEIFAHGKITP